MVHMNVDGMPKVRFVQEEPPRRRQWSGTAVEALFPSHNQSLVVGDAVISQPVVRVLGGPGTGKSALLVDLAVDYIKAGIPADSILVVSQSKEAAAALRRDIDQRFVSDLGQEGSVGAGQGGMVRAVHSLAFAVVRDAAVSRGEAEPSLTTGARQDAVVRQLLAGHAEDGGAYWPERLRPALPLVGFSRAVRDFLLRAAERGIDAQRLQQLGVDYGIESWSAAGKFMAEYQQTMRLAWEPSLNAAEIVSAALVELDADAQALTRWGKSVVLVDDAEHLSPEAARLVDRFVSQASVAIITGDEDQSVFHFRGANNDYLRAAGESGQRAIHLQHSYRCNADIAELANAVSQRLPKAPSYRGIVGTADEDELGRFGAGSSNEAAAQGKPHAAKSAVRIAIHPSERAQRATVADYFRRLHIDEGVAWKDMAVIVRSGAGESSLFRALSRAGVPVQIDPTDIVLSHQRLVRALMVALRATMKQLDDVEWDEFLSGPLVNMDPIVKERLLRGIRKADLFGEAAATQLIGILKADELTAEQVALIESLSQRERQALEVPLNLLSMARAALRDGVEATLWAIWQSTGLADHLVAASLRGGTAGASADRDLDAVMALFDFAGDRVELNPKLTVSGFIASVEEQELPIGSRDRSGVERDAVRILSAHAALGRQWKAVAVVGVQEGQWPSLGVTGSVMKQNEFIGLVDHGIQPRAYINSMADALAEERRLLHVAVSRASDSVLLTAVDSPDDVGVPSPFIVELGEKIGISATDSVNQLDGSSAAEDSEAEATEVADAGASAGDAHGAETEGGTWVGEGLPRVLSVESLLAELRAAVVDDAETETRRRQAARQLARLAQVGVPGAHPSTWWGLRSPSTLEPVNNTKPMRINPSKVEATLSCPLRAMLDKSAPTSAMYLGSLLHLAVEAVARGVTVPEAQSEIRRVFGDLSDDPEWRKRTEEETWLTALEDWQRWIETKKDVGTEVPVKVAINDDIVIVGRIDRLIEDADGAVQIVDIKTGKTPPTAKEVEEHAQLATYQLALSKGQLVERGGNLAIADGEGIEQSGAFLVFPRKSHNKTIITSREQSKLTDDKLADWERRVEQVARAATGPRALALAGDHCKFCTLSKACPAAEGKR